MASATRLSEASAWARDTPSFNRPIIQTFVAVRLSSQRLSGSSCTCMLMGTQTSGLKMSSVPLNDGGVTPSTVYTMPLMVTVRFTIWGSPAKRRCQQ